MKRNRRSRAEWNKLFEAQKVSGQTQAQFCRERGLCAKYFALKRRNFGAATDASNFVRVQPTAPLASTRVHLRWREVEIQFHDISAETLAQFVRSLS